MAALALKLAQVPRAEEDSGHPASQDHSLLVSSSLSKYLVHSCILRPQRRTRSIKKPFSPPDAKQMLLTASPLLRNSTPFNQADGANTLSKEVHASKALLSITDFGIQSIELGTTSYV